MVLASAGANRGLLQHPQTGRGLAGVPDAGAAHIDRRRCGNVPGYFGGNTRQMAQEVQWQCAPRSELRPGAQPPRPTSDQGPPGRRRWLATPPSPRGSTCRNTSVAQARPASRPGVSSGYLRGDFSGGDERRGEIALWPHILSQSQLDRGLHFSHRRVKVGHSQLRRCR